jgi:hypothetical protein
MVKQSHGDGGYNGTKKRSDLDAGLQSGGYYTKNHMLRKIDWIESFEYIYELLEPIYSETGRPSIEPVSLVKMLLIGYLFGIQKRTAAG